MPQTMQVRGVATTTYFEDGMTTIRYHACPVVRFTHEVIVLRCDGWFTNTTKTRMNQASNQYGLGYHVWQKDFTWFVDYKGETIKFSDGMVINRM
jgi:hypothetical protein